MLLLILLSFKLFSPLEVLDTSDTILRLIGTTLNVLVCDGEYVMENLD